MWRLMASDPQGKFRSLEPPGMVTSMRKMSRSGVIFVITITDTHNILPRDVLGKSGQGRDYQQTLSLSPDWVGILHCTAGIGHRV